VLRQKLHTALAEAAEAKSTGAPQFGQAARQAHCGVGWVAKLQCRSGSIKVDQAGSDRPDSSAQAGHTSFFSNSARA